MSVIVAVTHLNITSRQPDGRALPTHNHDLRILLISQPIQFSDLNARPNSNSAPRPIPRTRIILGKLDTLEAMRVDSQGTEARRAAHEIVARVADKETYIVCACKVHSRFDLLSSFSHDDVLGEVAEGAGSTSVVGGIA